MVCALLVPGVDRCTGDVTARCINLWIRWIPDQGDYGLGVRTPLAMMATNNGAFARYGFQLSRRQTSAARFVHVMHLTSKKRRYSVELTPYCW
jgi:hypothetical protein